jgi:hypothetical protein
MAGKAEIAENAKRREVSPAALLCELLPQPGVTNGSVPLATG